MRSAAGDDPDSGGTPTPTLPTGEESRGILNRSRGILAAGEKTGPTEEAQSVGDSQGKRRRVEGVSVGKKRTAEGGERMLAAEEVVLAARPLPPREIPYPKSGDHNEVVAWMNAKDALHDNNDLGDEDGMELYSRGVIIEYDEVGKCAKILSSSSLMCTKEGKLRHPQKAGEESGPTEEAQSVGDSQGKRRRVEGISVGKERAVEGVERMLTAKEVALEGVSVGKKRAAEGGERVLKAEEVVAWMHASGALRNTEKIGGDDSLLTLRRTKVSDDTKSVASEASMDTRDMILDVARSVVNVSATEPDGKVLYATGIIIEYDEVGKCAKILSSSSLMCTKEGKLRHPQKVSVKLSKDTVVEARVIFFNGHYGISLLDVRTGFPLVPASLGSRPCYGQDVSVLYRNDKYALVVSNGSIRYSENPFLERNHYMFTSCSTRLSCVGGPLINNSGEVIGLIVKHIPQAAIVSTSIVRKCIQMWNQFGRIAHPIHQLQLRSVRMLDVVHRDELWVSHNISSGFIVNLVCPSSTAEKIGLHRGDVIDLIDLDHRSTVVELEEYLLSLCWDLLEKKLDSASTIDIKIRVHDIRAKTSVCTVLPMEVSDAVVRSYY